MHRSGDLARAITHASGDEIARNSRRIADASPARAPHQVEMQVIVVVDVRSGPEHGRELLAGRRVHVVQETALLPQAAPAFPHRHLSSLWQRERGYGKRIA